jgi:hypothetical protein
MANILQLRRGTTAQNDAFTGSVAEVTVDTDRDSLRVHDGVTVGGKEIADLATAIPLLTDATTVGPADEFVVRQSGIVKRATSNEFLNGTGTVTATGSTTGRTLATRFADTINVKDFGAIGDGVANDTAAIQAALNAARDSGKQIYGQVGNYRVTSTINIECSGDMSAMTIQANGTTLTPVVRLGKATGFSVGNLQIRLPKIFNTARVAGDGWVGYANNIGLTVDNIVDSIVTVGEINGFGIGASIGGTDSGNQTNQYFISFIYRCRLGLLVDRKSVNGWSNENTYHIGRFRKDSNEARVISGITASASTDTFTKTAHGLTDGTAIVFTVLTGGSGLTIDTLSYFVINATANTFQVSETSGGSAVDILTDYSSVTVQYPWPDTACLKVGRVNNNVFVRPCVETSMAVDERALVLEDASYCLFLSPRYEIQRTGTARAPVLLEGTFGSACTGNCFLAGLDFVANGILYDEKEGASGAVYSNTIIGNGRSSQLFSAQNGITLQNPVGDGVSQPQIQGIGSSSSINPNNFLASSTNWQYRLHSHGLNGKRTADDFPRLRLDWNASNGTGRIFFGLGTTDPTTFITGLESSFTFENYPSVRMRGPSGSLTQIQNATVTLSGLSGATATATNFIPAGSIVLGVTVRVLTAITGATTFDIGDGTDVDRWGAGRAIAVGTTTTAANFTITSIPIYASATSVVLTANGSNFTAGEVKLSIAYISVGAPAA